MHFWDRFTKKVLAHRTLIIVGLIIAAGTVVRVHNVRTYTTWWADDGGAHLMYIDTIAKEHRLPTMGENYLAWHEPLYYVLQAGWKQVAPIVFISSLNWMETLQVIIFACLACIVALLAHERSKNIYITAAAVLGTTFIFVFVKLSAYVTNELLAQTLILLLVYLFVRWRLAEIGKWRIVVVWSILLGVAALVKMTAGIVAIAAAMVWLWQAYSLKRKEFLLSIALMAGIAGAMHSPWLWYKYQHFGQAFTINVYESATKQPLTKSAGWQYLSHVNTSIVRSHPYWFRLPHSVWTILYGDAFSDYYNLFSHVDSIHLLPASSVRMIDNGRYAPVSLMSTVLWTNRVSLLVAGVWAIGLIGWLSSRIKTRSIDAYDVFLFLMISGGCAAVLYNMLRHPYLERGVVKMQFIAFVIPLIMCLSYEWWGSVLKSRLEQCIVYLIPWIVYIAVAWPMLWVHPF